MPIVNFRARLHIADVRDQPLRIVIPTSKARRNLLSHSLAERTNDHGVSNDQRLTTSKNCHSEGSKRQGICSLQSLAGRTNDHGISNDQRPRALPPGQSLKCSRACQANQPVHKANHNWKRKQAQRGFAIRSRFVDDLLRVFHAFSVELKQGTCL
jgi:hypothetical protein